MSWTIRETKPTVKWASIVQTMCEALDADESAEFARVGEYIADRTPSVQHIANTLAKLPALDARFAVVRVENGTERDVALVRK
jgi:hypothetical protein